MTTAPVDPRFALDSANASDLVQKKVSIDAMRKRVSGGPSEEKKLRGACEGFESIFLQKMWEQMRKNVKKEGYLHSKDEEAYQSMFDTELAKKMASAGGIGLADMLYEQLGQKLTNASRTTSPGAARTPLPIEPAKAPKPEEPPKAAEATAPMDLYSDMMPEEEKPVDPAKLVVDKALTDLAESRDPALDPANATYPMFDLQTGAPMNPVAERIKEEAAPKREYDLTPMPERVTAPGKAKPSNSGRNIARSSRHSRRNAARSDGAAGPPGMAPQARGGETQAPAAGPGAIPAAGVEPKNGWPVSGDVVSSYGRQAEGGGWNTGMAFAAASGSPVIAPADGVVAFAGEKDGTGYVALDHGNGLTSHYRNVSATLTQGTPIAAGMEFAKLASGIGFSGAGTADAMSRMQFELRRGELAVNPEILLG